MGRYTSDTGGADQPRKKTITLFASDPAVPVPEWAQSGVVYVTGCGAGAGGGNSTTAAQRGGGGGGGGYAVRLAVPLTGVASISVIIGAPGIGADGSSNAAGSNAGTTVITVGGVTVRLDGGKGGLSVSGGAGGVAIIGADGDLALAFNNQPIGSAGAASLGLNGSLSPMASGAGGAPGNGPSQRYGTGAMSPFGGGGYGLTSPPAAGETGATATGYGAGGAGSQGAGKAGDGAPSFVMLEFEEVA